MLADDLLSDFDLDGLREFHNGVEGLRDAAIRIAGSSDTEIEAAGRIAGYNKVLAELKQRIAAKECA